MSRILYLRCSTLDQSIEAQRAALGQDFDREYIDRGVSGAVLAADRPAFAMLLDFVRDGDTVAVYDVSRLGRDALDVQSVVRKLMDKGVAVEVHGLGCISRGVGEIVLAVLSQVAEMERLRIRERCEAGRKAARASLKAVGKTHRGKTSLGRPKAADAKAVASWRAANSASIAKTAQEFGISIPSVKRYCAAVAAEQRPH